MAAKKKTTAGEKITAKNAKILAMDSSTPAKKTIAKETTKQATPAKKTIAKQTTKQAVSKETSDTKIKSTADSANIPAFYPEYPGYRLADIIATTEWREDNIGTLKSMKEWVESSTETLQEYVFRLFPTSIACQYLKKTQRVNNMNVLSSIVDEFMISQSIPVPEEDVMVMHLRVGDVIDGTGVPADDFLNRRVNSWFELFGTEPDGWSPVYVRCLASFDRALKKTKELGLNKITLVYGFHIRQPVDKSKEYIAGLVQYARSQGFEVEIMTHADADVSFAYACKAKHFIPGGGGFSKLMSKVVMHKGNGVYYVRV